MLIGALMIYLHKAFHVSSSNDALIIYVNKETK
jgi:hypothetical protein